MASHDPAFQWETEMLRSSRRSRRPGGHTPGTMVDSGDWLPLREASMATGVPVSTIRKWVRHENIPSFMEQTADGYLRIVSMSGIERWTSEIGRDIDRQTAPSKTSRGVAAPGGDIDLTVGHTSDRVEAETSAPEGSMLVPLDAWNRMLNQLGNLHEAGQRLAEARERAAKAETEARFLKERLADLREELERAREAESDETGRASSNDPGSDEGDSSPFSPTAIVKTIYDGWRSRRRRGS